MVACEQNVDVGDDARLVEQTLQRWPYLLLDVVIVVYGNVLLEYADGIFGVLVIF